MFVVIALLMGLEAGSLQRWTLARRKWRQFDTVVARNARDAEQRFFDRFSLDSRIETSRGPLPPLPHASIAEDVTGFFPAAPGVRR